MEMRSIPLAVCVDAYTFQVYASRYNNAGHVEPPGHCAVPSKHAHHCSDDKITTESKRLISRRQFLTAAGAAAAGTALYTGEYERHNLVIENHDAALPRLADAFHGMRIVQISDIHFQEFSEAFYIRHVVEQVNALQPDMVVLTGDYITIGPLPRHFAARWSYHCAALLEAIQCPLRYAVLGNHDAVVNMAAVTDALQTHGIPVLANRYVPIERDGRRFWLGGVSDVSEGLARIETAVPPPPTRNNDPVILLAHEPDYADTVARHGGVDLILSGHTHGGQIRLPFMKPHFLPDYGKKYVAGLFQLGSTRLYVNRGIGTVMLPMRLRCPPEITVHTLSSEK